MELACINSKNGDLVLLLEADSHKCEMCKCFEYKTELRPFGNNGAWICVNCGDKYAPTIARNSQAWWDRHTAYDAVMFVENIDDYIKEELDNV